MGSRLVNVRLDADRLRKSRTLRRRGIALSSVVRTAIDERYAELRSVSHIDIKAIVNHIFEQYPDPADVPARGYSVHDGRAARMAVRRTLRRRRS